MILTEPFWFLGKSLSNGEQFISSLHFTLLTHILDSLAQEYHSLQEYVGEFSFLIEQVAALILNITWSFSRLPTIHERKKHPQ